VDSMLFEEGEELDVRIGNLHNELLPDDKQSHGLRGQRIARYKKLKDYEELVKEINEADTWEKLKTTYEKSGYSFVHHSMPSFNDLEEIKQRILNAYSSKEPQILIEKETKEIKQSIKD